ncbi:MAG: DUF4349 domain-containing protein [Oscillospiraceae bacterium]|nr:DUF4349 domain-containing protein [Oscillospiraceae bacterium]
MKRTPYTRVLSLAAAALLILLLLAACGGGMSSSPQRTMGDGAAAPAAAESHPDSAPAPQPSPAYAADAGEGGAGGGSGATATQPPDTFHFASQNVLPDPARKLIREAALVVETTDFAGGTAELERLCASAGGYVESSTVPGLSLTAGTRAMRSAHYLFRIPVGEYAYFVQTAGQAGNLLSRTETSTDITDSYFDTEAHLKVLLIRRDRLLVLLEEATDSKAIVDFEQSLSETQYEIERLTGTLQKYDALVSYATVDVTLQEVVSYTDPPAIVVEPETTGGRIAQLFGDSAHKIGDFFVSLFVFFAGNILYLLLSAALLILLLLLIRKLRTRPKKPKQPKPMPVYPGYPIATQPANRPTAPPAAPAPAAPAVRTPAPGAPEAAGDPPGSNNETK